MPRRRQVALVLLALCLLYAGMGLAEGMPQRPAIVFLAEADPKPALGDEALLEVHFLSVEAADCILLRNGERAMLIDCGNLGTGDAVVDYLRGLRVEALDFAFMTHYHNDHIAGFIRVLAEIPVMQVILPEGFWDYRSGVLRQIRDIMEERGMAPFTIGNRASLPFGAAQLTFFQYERTQVGMNDRSIVALASLGSRAALFSADVENRGQNGLAEAHGEALRADILKMPHHGIASYQRAFHEAVRPQLVTFSNYARRIEPTIAQVDGYGLPWLLTTDGTIIAVTDGETWRVWQETADDPKAGAAPLSPP